MTLFRNVVFIAALAGLVAGIALAAMQAFATDPLILQAEVFEMPAAAIRTNMQRSRPRGLPSQSSTLTTR